MALKLKYFTVKEAEALIPTIQGVMDAALETKFQIEKKVDDWRKVHKSINEVEDAVFRGQVDFLAAHLEKQLEQITELGCLPKDLDQGLVDFPARIDSKEAYLCWRMGEKKITHWHGLTEGFGGRKPIRKGD
jgi:hypothetical protein